MPIPKRSVRADAWQEFHITRHDAADAYNAAIRDAMEQAAAKSSAGVAHFKTREKAALAEFQAAIDAAAAVLLRAAGETVPARMRLPN